MVDMNKVKDMLVEQFVFSVRERVIDSALGVKPVINEENKAYKAIDVGFEIENAEIFKNEVKVEVINKLRKMFGHKKLMEFIELDIFIKGTDY